MRKIIFLIAGLLIAVCAVIGMIEFSNGSKQPLIIAAISATGTLLFLIALFLPKKNIKKALEEEDDILGI